MLKTITNIKSRKGIEDMPGSLIGAKDWASFVKQVQENLTPTYNLEKSLRWHAIEHDKPLAPFLQMAVDEAMERVRNAIADAQCPTDPMEVLHRAQHDGFKVGDERVRTLLAYFLLPMVEAEFPRPPGKSWSDVFMPKGA